MHRAHAEENVRRACRDGFPIRDCPPHHCPAPAWTPRRCDRRPLTCSLQQLRACAPFVDPHDDHFRNASARLQGKTRRLFTVDACVTRCRVHANGGREGLTAITVVSRTSVSPAGADADHTAATNEPDTAIRGRLHSPGRAQPASFASRHYGCSNRGKRDESDSSNTDSNGISDLVGFQNSSRIPKVYGLSRQPLPLAGH